LAYLYRFLCALGVLAAVWAGLLWFTGGFRVQLAGLRISSQRPRNAFVISVLCLMVAGLLTLLPDGRETFRDEWARWRHWYISRGIWRARAERVVDISLSAFAVAAVAIVIDIYQWRAALPLWVDEEAIALNVRDRSIGDLAGSLWLGQSAPFGWLVLERMAMATFGTGETALRAVPLLFGIATIGVAVWAGRRWMGRIAALVFVLLCWIGPLLSHYRFEVKHYTADVLFGLLLPVLAAWAIEADRPTDRARRVWIWWIAAAIGHWFANGALLVTPACVIFLCVAVWRRDGRRATAWFVAGGLLWLASFGLHYLISIRYSLNSTYLRSIWGTEMLPSSLGLTGSMRWLFDRLEPLAFNPGGTALSALLWTSAICGFAFAIKRPLGFVLAGVPLSAFAFAAVVPLYQRFSIWIVPALYAGVALLIDRNVRLGSSAFVRRRWALFAIAMLVLFVQAQLVRDIFKRGRVDLDGRRASIYKHQLDDRAAVRWLMSQRKTGDVLMSTHLALFAVWWYGMIPISDQAGAGSVLDDGSPVYEVGPTTDCPSPQLDEALKNHRRVLLYLGFDFTPGFDQVLLNSLAQRGGVTAYREFGQLGLAAVFDLQQPGSGSIRQLNRTTTAAHVDAGGCVGVGRAERW
jgi:hypothetical protein